jgi:hypothetical protein
VEEFEGGVRLFWSERPIRDFVRRSQSEGPGAQRPSQGVPPVDLGLTRSFSGEFTVSSVSGSAEQLTLDNVSCMGDLMIIHRMQIRKAKKHAGNRSRKHPTALPMMPPTHIAQIKVAL